MQKVLVIGSSGMLGYAVSDYFRNNGFNVICIDRTDFDAALDPVEKLSEQIKDADFTINCVGVIKPRIADLDVLDVLRVNGIFPLNLAKLCNKHSKKLFHITTDCVYSGKKGGYTEDDYYDADDLYGISKNMGDGAECMVLRTSIIGPEKGQSRSLLEWVFSQRGQKVNGFTDHFWNGVTTYYLAEIIRNIVDGDRYTQGVFHIFSKEVTSKYELLKLIDEIFNLNLKIDPVASSSFCDRSLASKHILSNTLSVKSLREQFQDIQKLL